MHAILSDYPAPLSTDDERNARELLAPLAAAADADNALSKSDRDQDQDDVRSLPRSALQQDVQDTVAAQEAREGLLGIDASRPAAAAEAEDDQLRRLLDQVAAELAPGTASSATGQSRSAAPSTAEADVSGAEGVREADKLARTFEAASLADGSTSSMDGTTRSAELGSRATAAGTMDADRAGRFWPPSDVSSVTTASERGGAAVSSPIHDDRLDAATTADDPTVPPAALVWDPTPVDDDFGFYEVEDDPLAFLASVFPHIELAQLETKIQEATKAKQQAQGAVTGGTGEAAAAGPELSDLEALIEDLLSQDLITSLTEADAEAAAAENAPAPDPDRIADLSKQQKRRVKAAHKASHSYSLTSTPHGSYTPSVGQAPEDGRSASALASAPSGANAWVSFSSQASLLATLLHIPPTRVTSTYYQQSSSLPQTISVLLTQLASERVFETLPNALELRTQLRLIVPPGRASDDDLEVLLSATEGDLSDALDLHHFIREVESKVGTSLTLSSLVSHDSPAGAGSTPGTPGAIPGTPDGFSLVPGAAARRPPAVATTAVGSERYSQRDCVALALEYLVKRNEAFRTAARSFQRGGVGERGAAGYWAEKGREYDRERRKWEERAARATVGERRCVPSPYSLSRCALPSFQA